MLLLDCSEPNQHVQTAVFRRCRDGRISLLQGGCLEQQSSFCVFIPTGNSTGARMPYLFWAVLPFALMDTWWGMCEDRRDTE